MTSNLSSYPSYRARRLRQQGWTRDLVEETKLSSSDFIWPIFVNDGTDQSVEISTMPGVFSQSIDRLDREIERAISLGIKAVALFPVIAEELRDERGSQAIADDNLVCKALRKSAGYSSEIGLMADVALDPFTSHRHDGVLAGNGDVDNDRTIEILKQQSLLQADAGATILSPSDMMDGRIGAIRSVLDANNHTSVILSSYSVKYASCFYGPFRDALQSRGKLIGDKKGYQMNPCNRREAHVEAQLDINEGADMLIVKPGMPYLDIIRDIANSSPIPVIAYQVSGEYAMLSFAAKAGALELEPAVLESLIAFKRAGASAIISYFAPLACELLISN